MVGSQEPARRCAWCFIGYPFVQLLLFCDWLIDVIFTSSTDTVMRLSASSSRFRTMLTLISVALLSHLLRCDCRPGACGGIQRHGGLLCADSEGGRHQGGGTLLVLCTDAHGLLYAQAFPPIVALRKANTLLFPVHTHACVPPTSFASYRRCSRGWRPIMSKWCPPSPSLSSHTSR